MSERLSARRSFVETSRPIGALTCCGRAPLSQLQGALNSREREISSLRRQLDAGHGELAALRRDKQVAARENRRLQEDLTSVTRENQAVLGEVEAALHEKDELQLRAHSYISEVARIEKVMAAKARDAPGAAPPGS